jgi:ribosomal protein S6--L-glutamate ligase
MKAAIISLRSVSSKWIAEALKSYFDEVDDISLNDMEVRTSTHGLILRYKGGKLPEYDCIYAKGSFRFPLLLRSVAEVLSKKCYMPLRPDAYTVGTDKWLTYLLLQKNGVPMPATYLSPTLNIAKKILKEVTYPVIMKFPSGTQGKGVMYAGDYAAASSMLDALSTLNQAVIIQEYIETDGTDMRLIVAGEEVVAAMRRIAVSEEKRANIHAGGKGIAFEPDEITKRVAIRTAQAVGADICAVDLLPSAKGPLVIEVNLSPGLQGITKATNSDVADKIAKFLYKKTGEYISKKSSSDSSDVFKEMGIDHHSHEKTTEIITNLEFRGHRVLLPESVTNLAKLNEKDEYVVKIEGKDLVVKKL